MKGFRTIALSTVLAAAMTAAAAQSWYAPGCCPQTGCRPARPGEVRQAAGGYYIEPLRLFVSAGDPRVLVSGDAGYHLCTAPAATPDMEISACYLAMDLRTLKCLYVPALSRPDGGRLRGPAACCAAVAKGRQLAAQQGGTDP